MRTFGTFEKDGNTKVAYTAVEAVELVAYGWEQTDAADDGSGAPAKSGRGSGRDAWQAYAEANDVDVTDEMTRDDIIAAVEAAGVTTE